MSYTFSNISNTFIKVRWKEQYGSSGLNKKLYGIVAHGIYRGLVLGTSGSNNTVTVVPDASTSDHLAVYETADGYSITLRDDTNTTYTLDLSDASLLSQTVIITLFVEYKEGSSSVAYFSAYTLAEYNALSASLKSELIVLGTVANPAGGNTIDAAAISEERRTLASQNIPLIGWKPVLGNTGFERSSVGAIVGFGVDGWASSGAWESSNTDVGTGTRCVQYNSPSASSGQTESMTQYIGTSVTAGQKILVKLSKKVVATASAGNGLVLVGFTGDDGGSAVEQTQTFDIQSTDASYQSSDYYFTVPAGSITLKYIGFSIDSATYGSAGVKVRVDSVEAYIEPLTNNDTSSAIDDRYRSISASALAIDDVSGSSYSDRSAMFTFKRNVPVNEGQVVLGRRDQNYSGNLPPALKLDGRLINIGNKLLDSNATATMPRITAQATAASGARYTLIAEYAKDGEIAGAYTQPPLRHYVESEYPLVDNGAGSNLFVVNAYWDGTQWVRDVDSYEASVTVQNSSGLSVVKRAVGDATWTVWQTIYAAKSSVAGGDGIDFTTTGTGSFRVQGTGDFKHGERSFAQGFEILAHSTSWSGWTYSGGVHSGTLGPSGTVSVPIIAPLLSTFHKITKFKITFDSSNYPTGVTFTKQRFSPTPVISTLGSFDYVITDDVSGSYVTRTYTLNLPDTSGLVEDGSRWIVNLTNGSGVASIVLYALITVYESV